MYKREEEKIKSSKATVLYSLKTWKQHPADRGGGRREGWGGGSDDDGPGSSLSPVPYTSSHSSGRWMNCRLLWPCRGGQMAAGSHRVLLVLVRPPRLKHDESGLCLQAEAGRGASGRHGGLLFSPRRADFHPPKPERGKWSHCRAAKQLDYKKKRKKAERLRASGEWDVDMKAATAAGE